MINLSGPLTSIHFFLLFSCFHFSCVIESYTLRKKCWNYVDFPHTLRFSYFPHMIEVDNSPHNLMWKVHLEKKLSIVCGMSNACRSMWKIYIYTMISLSECNMPTISKRKDKTSYYVCKITSNYNSCESADGWTDRRTLPSTLSPCFMV